MRKTIAFLLIFVMVLSLAACGSLETEIASADSITIGGEKIEEENAATKETYTEASISEMVLLDEAGVRITVKELDLAGLFGTELKLLIENNTDTNLTFQSRNTSVNGYMVETMMSVDVAAGKKANDSLTIMKSSLDTCGIKTIADIGLSFHIFTSDNWTNYLDTPQIEIKTSAADTYEYVFDDSGDLVYNENGVKIVIKGLDKNASLLGPGILVYMENSGNRNVTIQTREVSINGFMVDSIFSAELIPGKHRLDTITFMSSDLENNGITDIDSVEISFHIFDSDSWEVLSDTDAITLNF